jgi:ubiquinone biosynthesis protein
LGVIRGFEIAFILIEFLIIDRMSHRRWMFGLIPKRFKKDGIVQTEPERLRTVIELLGPTFVKFGQILADRPDIISDKLRAELKKLQSTVEPFSHNKAMELIEEELGGKIENFFAEFKGEASIGSASIGQVYKGTLKTGEEVVVKIQRPDIKAKIELDLRILTYFAEQLVNDYPGFRVVDVVGIVEEFGESLIKELNYLNEASNAIRFNSIFQNAEYCKIPKVYLDLTTDKMLVMEFVDGTPPDSRQLLLDAGLNPSEVARNGSVILLEMIFKHGFFHADPHPGNLFIQTNNTIAIIDFGMVGILKPAHMHFLAGFAYGLASNNASTITDAVLTLCGKKYFAERNDLEFYIRDMLNHHGAFSYENLDFSQVLNECLKIIQRYDLKLPGNMFLLIKALATIEKFGFNLDPEMSLAAVIRPYAEHLIKEKFSPKQIAGDIFDTLKDYGSLIRDFPAEINEILYRLKKGRIGIDINIEDEKVLVNGFKQVGGVLSITLLLGFMLAGSTVLLIYGKAITAASILFGISVFFSVSLLMRLFIKTRL